MSNVLPLPLFKAPNPYQSMADWGQPANLGGLVQPPPMMTTDPAAVSGMVQPPAGAALFDPVRAGLDVSVNQVTQPNPWMSDWMKSIVGTKEAPGWGGLALGGANAIMSGFMGMQQYGLAKKTLEESKRQYDQNYSAQRQTVNTQLEDRQRARVASNPGAYQSVSDYMSQNRIA